MRTLKIQLSDELEQEVPTLQEISEASFRDDILKAARAISCGSDALETAESFLPLDNEALDLVQS